ncbi:hypothetical protein [Desulfomarina profundi]|uniref:hypothetical protein n=1 Tax=Desulfomarina profundi TaxID=2772557 RepID=UPI001E4F785A|nr:hypothetical protein [Desulfomarina profundi]
MAGIANHVAFGTGDIPFILTVTIMTMAFHRLGMVLEMGATDHAVLIVSFRKMYLLCSFFRMTTVIV